MAESILVVENMTFVEDEEIFVEVFCDAGEVLAWKVD